jgi:hypothetical protein
MFQWQIASVGCRREVKRWPARQDIPADLASEYPLGHFDVCVGLRGFDAFSDQCYSGFLAP